MSATLPPETSAPATPLQIFEDSFSILALSLMTALPVIEMIARQFRWSGIPGSAVVVQQLTLWIGMLGGMLASRSGRLLGLSSSGFLPESWIAPAKIFWSAALAAVSTCLAYASWVFVQSEREAGSYLLPGLPKWTALAIMLAGFAIIALRAVWNASAGWTGRAIAALGLFVPALFGYAIPMGAPGVLPLSFALLALATIVGLPIFAVFGGLALLLFWSSATPVASVPVEMYRLVASPLLPSIPLFTLAGYFMVQGGATKRLLRVFTALFSWIPGGLAIATVAICTVFTFAGSGLTILSLGGLLVPMLIKTRYPENFSIGLLTSSGSLGLLFPTSIPAILYCVYSQTPLDRLFTGAILPELLMISAIAFVGVRMGIKSGAVSEPFSLREAGAAIWSAKWELALPIIMIVGLFGGFGTLTEAAALTAFCAFVVEVFIYGDLKPRNFREVFVECATIVGGILLILGVALGFTNYLVDAEVPSHLIDWVQIARAVEVSVPAAAQHRAASGRRADGHLRRNPGCRPAAQAARRSLFDRSGADGRHLHRKPRARLPAPAGRHQPVSLRLPLQETNGHHHLGHPAIPADPRRHRAPDHLRPLAHHRPAPLAG